MLDATLNASVLQPYCMGQAVDVLRIAPHRGYVLDPSFQILIDELI